MYNVIITIAVTRNNVREISRFINNMSIRFLKILLRSNVSSAVCTLLGTPMGHVVPDTICQTTIGNFTKKTVGPGPNGDVAYGRLSGVFGIVNKHKP